MTGLRSVRPDDAPLRVGLNLMVLAEGFGGVVRYVSELLPELLAAEPGIRLTAFINSDAPGSWQDRSWSDSVDWVHWPVHVASRRALAREMLALPSSAARRGLDVIHSPGNVGPWLTPGVAHVVTMHDLIWLHYAKQWEESRRARIAARVLYSVAAKSATRVITVSEAVRADLIATLGLTPEKVDVVPQGVRIGSDTTALAEPELRRRYELADAPLVLCVAQKRPYKNLATLITALTQLDDRRAILVLPGAATRHEAELRRLAAELGVSDRVRFLDWLDEAELEGFYRAAACFACPSLIEGFGLPVLEAFARGVPVACSNRWALPEVAGDAALLFDPERQEQVTGALNALLSDRELARRLAARGHERARHFSWRRTAVGTIASYRRAVATRRHAAGRR